MESGGGGVLVEGPELPADDDGLVLLQAVHGAEERPHHSDRRVPGELLHAECRFNFVY